MFLLFISFGPEDPAIEAHDCVIEIHAGFPIKLAFDAQIYIDDGVDEANRVNKDVFLPAEPNTGDAGDHCDEFEPARLLESVNKLLPNGKDHS